MVGIAVLAALVVVLQLLSSVIKIGTVSKTLAGTNVNGANTPS